MSWWLREYLLLVSDSGGIERQRASILVCLYWWTEYM